MKVLIFTIGLMLAELIISTQIMRAIIVKIIFKISMFSTKALVFRLLILLDKLLKHSYHLVG